MKKGIMEFWTIEGDAFKIHFEENEDAQTFIANNFSASDTVHLYKQELILSRRKDNE